MRVPLIALALATLLWVAPSLGDDTASRVIDLTYRCSVTRHAGVRDVKVEGTTGTGWIEDRSQWKRLASASVSDWSGNLGWVSAGNPLAPDESGYRFPPRRLSIPATGRCRQAHRIPFTTRGLTGGAASPLTDTVACLPGARVTVRIRGLFRAPTTLKLKIYERGERVLEASGTVERGELALQSAAGRPLAYLDVRESGTARLLQAEGCVAD